MFFESLAMEVFLSEVGIPIFSELQDVVFVSALTVALVATVLCFVVSFCSSLSCESEPTSSEATVSVTRWTTQNQVRVLAGSFSLHTLPILPQDQGPCSYHCPLP